MVLDGLCVFAARHSMTREMALHISSHSINSVCGIPPISIRVSASNLLSEVGSRLFRHSQRIA